jgi:hypothetical protein
MQRTDFTSEIDGALAGRNLGSRHYSDVARSGNGNMLSDLSEDQLADYQELDGMGEATEELSLGESQKLDNMGWKANLPRFRNPRPGEVAPFAPKPGMGWLRKRMILPERKPGGNRVAKVKWVQVTPRRLNELAAKGDVAGMGAMSTGVGVGLSAGIGIVAGIGIWLLIKRRK